MKKRILVVLGLAFALGVNGCGKAEIGKEKEVVKCIEREVPVAGSVSETEYNELGDVVLITSTVDGRSTTVRYTWKDTENSREAYLDGMLRIKVGLDKNGNKISSKSYDEKGGLMNESYYEYDNLGNLKTSSTYKYNYDYHISEEPVIYHEEYLEYGKYGKDGNIVTEHIVSYGTRLDEDSESYVQYATEYYYEYNEYGEVASGKYVYEGMTEENTIYEYQRSKDGKNSVGRAYVYDAESEELIEEYDEYEYEYDENGNMISQCRYYSDGDLFTRYEQEYNENGSLSAKYFYRSGELWEATKYTYYEQE